MKNIVLCGFMGSGKTHVGKRLAEILNLEFTDTDKLIEQTYSMKVSEIFSKYGEDVFRRAEAKVCMDLSTKQGLVIATGGGVVLREENVKNLKQNGIIFFLNVTPQTVLARLKNDNTRPLLKENKQQKVSELLYSRLPLYTAAADHTIDANRPPALVVKSILKILNYQP